MKRFMSTFLRFLLILLSLTFSAFANTSEEGKININFFENASILRISGDINSMIVGDVTLMVYYIDRGINNLQSMKYFEQQTVIGSRYSFSYKMTGKTGLYRVMIGSNKLSVPLTADFYYKNPIDVISSDTNIDDYTTTKYAPWMTLYHMTSIEQILADHKGGEAGQAGLALAISPTNPDLLLSGTDLSGIWRSEDGGNEWRAASSGLMTDGVCDLRFDPDNSNIAYALGSGRSNIEATLRSVYPGIYKSTDGGITWTQTINLPIVLKQGRYIQFGNVNQNGNRSVYVAVNSGGVYRSDDNGDTWNVIGLQNDWIMDLLVKDNIILASTQNSGIMASFDGGTTWVSRNTGLDSYFVNSSEINPQNSSNWFAITTTVLYESTNAGLTWTPINSTANVQVESFRLLKMSNVPSGQTPILYLGTSIPGPSIRYSTNYGRNFNKPTIDTRLSFMTNNKGFRSEPIEISTTNPNLIYVYLDGDIYRSDDGGINFYSRSSAYSGMRASNFLFNADDDYDIGIATVDRGFFKTVDKGGYGEYPVMDYSTALAIGRFSNVLTTRAVARDPKNSKRYIVINGDGSGATLKQTFDDGVTWSEISGLQQYYNILPGNLIAFHPQNPNIIYAGYIKSYDDGVTWNRLDYKVTAVSNIDGDVVYSAIGNTVAKSIDGGQTWQVLTNAYFGLQRSEVDLFNKDKLYVGTFTAGLLIIDGTDITQIGAQAGIIPSEGTLPVYDVAQNPKNPLHLILGGANNWTYAKSTGIHESFDGGVSWRQVQGMPASRDVWVVDFHPNLPKVFIGTSAGTYVYEYEKYIEGDVIVQTCEEDISENTGFISRKIWNTTDKVLSFDEVFAIYNNQHSNMETLSINNYTINPLEYIDISRDIPKDLETHGKNFKILLWENMNTLRPVSAPYRSSLSVDGLGE